MKLPVRYGIPLLVVLLLAAGQVEGALRTLLLVMGMGAALWTAFSLPRPPQPPADEDERDELKSEGDN